MKKFTVVFIALMTLNLVAPCSYAKRDAKLRRTSQEAIELLTSTDPGLEHWFKEAYGYAIFPTIGKAGFWIGGAFGKGEVYEKGKFLGEARLTQGSVGFQWGGQAYVEVIFFENERNLENFKDSNFALSAQASAVAAAEGAAANAKYEHGVAVFTVAKGGIMLEASVGGQKFKYLPKD